MSRFSINHSHSLGHLLTEASITSGSPTERNPSVQIASLSYEQETDSII